MGVHNDLVFKGKTFVMARENSFNHRIVTLVATTKLLTLPVA